MKTRWVTSAQQRCIACKWFGNEMLDFYLFCVSIELACGIRIMLYILVDRESRLMFRSTAKYVNILSNVILYVLQI